MDIRLRGRRRPAEVEVITDEAGVVELYGVIARGNHQFADFTTIDFDRDGTPNPAALRAAGAGGGRVIRLTPR